MTFLGNPHVYIRLVKWWTRAARATAVLNFLCVYMLRRDSSAVGWQRFAPKDDWKSLLAAGSAVGGLLYTYFVALLP